MARIDKQFSPPNEIATEVLSLGLNESNPAPLNAKQSLGGSDEFSMNGLSPVLGGGLEIPPDAFCDLLRQAQGAALKLPEPQFPSGSGMESDSRYSLLQLLESHQRLQETQTQIAARLAALELDLAQRNARLQESTRDMAAVCQALAHDLPESLGGLTSGSQPLAAENGIQMARLLADLSRYGQMSCAPVVCENLDLETLVATVVGQRITVIADYRAEVRSRAPLRRVWADPSLLPEALGHLLDNALKFTRPGVLTRVLVRAEIRHQMIRIYVEDNGIGIAPEHQPWVFGLFARLENKGPGTGVGLALVRKAAERMGGQVGVESQLGKGSRFWIDLPTPD